MKKTGIAFLTAISLIMFSHVHASWAETVYNISSGDVPIRSTPEATGNVFGSISPGDPVEIRQANRWVLIEFQDDSGNSRRGWVDSILLGPRPPEGILVKQLEEENTSLKATLSSLQSERSDLVETEKLLTEKLATMESDYEELKSGAADYLQLKGEHETTLVALAQLQEDFETLSQENESLKISQRIKWFGAGGLVLLVGWFMGWLNGRHQKRKKSTYFM